MMEKNGMLMLTEKDMNLYKQGEVSDHLKEEWGLDFDSMDTMVKQGSFQIVNDDNSSEK